MNPHPDNARTVLLVDDDVDIREVVAEALEIEGFDVQQADNGEAALARLRSQASRRPCVILLDLMMPVMDGHQFRAAQKADALLADIPVVVISAGGGCEQAARDMGAVACVKKPFTVEQLLGELERYC